MPSKYFHEIDKNNPTYLEIFTDKSLDIVEYVYELLKSKGLSQKDLADIMGKNESEISKWLSGGHNITLLTISRIEDALNETILAVPNKENLISARKKKKEDFQKIKVDKRHSEHRIKKFIVNRSKTVKIGMKKTLGGLHIKHSNKDSAIPKASKHTRNLKPLESY